MSSLEGDTRLYAKETASKTGDQKERENLDVDNFQIKAASLVSPYRESDDAPSALEPNLMRCSTSYVLTRSEHLESNVDCWLRNAQDSAETRTMDGQQGSVSGNSGIFATLWYIAAFLPILNVHSALQQGLCSPRNSFMVLLNSIDVILTGLKQLLSYVIARLSIREVDQILHTCFAMGVNAILTLHALVFLALSYYEISY